MEKIELTTNDWQELTGLTADTEYLLQNESAYAIYVHEGSNPADDNSFVIHSLGFYDFKKGDDSIYLKKFATQTNATIVITTRN